MDMGIDKGVDKHQKTDAKPASTSYDIASSEKHWQEQWQKKKIYSFKEQPGKQNYVIDTPPPTVSGKMHIGHAFSYTQQDFIARYKRMRGFNVCYPFGTDDNGLPTERLIEKMKNVRSTHMDRKEFIALCNQTVKELKPDFIQDWKNAGMSCDFEGSYSTIDNQCIATSQASFLDLFEKGRVYQEESPISWCTTCQTAIAQAEFESVDKASHFNDIVFKVDGKELVVATTRPELLPSCVAVFAHPTDARYKHIIGKHATVPLMNHTVPVLADMKADPEKGTGLVMCCTFGDKVDIEWWKEHKLPLRVSIGRDGKMTTQAGPYAGLKIKEARAKIIEDLKAAGLLIRQKDITHPVNTHERCGTDVEFLKTKQWFVRVLDMKEELIEVADQITWYPEYMKARYVHWVENLNWDWCISRQRHFGVPFPVWYEKDTGKAIIASYDQLPCDPLSDKPKHYKGDVNNLVPETDVMDTWATSSVTPLIITNWKSQGKYETNFKTHFPTSLRPQAHDIIRTWAFYTIVKSLLNTGKAPWKDIVISGHVLDPSGNKMSKSKGNTIEPKIVFEKFGADAMRFWSASSKLGDDLPYQEKDLLTGKKTINKLWNACSFMKMGLAGYDNKSHPKLEAIDTWVLLKLNEAIVTATAAFDEYEYARARMVIDHFFWKVLCDNYLEIVKDRLYNAPARSAQKESAQFVLSTILRDVIKLYAPIMPFVTESCWHEFVDSHTKSVHLESWPTVHAVAAESGFAELGDCAVEIVALIRQAKSSQKMALNAPLSSVTVLHPKADALGAFVNDIKATVKAGALILKKGESSVEIQV